MPPVCFISSVNVARPISPTRREGSSQTSVTIGSTVSLVCPPSGAPKGVSEDGDMTTNQYRAMDRLGARPTLSARASSSNSKTDSAVCPGTVTGMDYLRNPRLFKGMGFSLEERQSLGT